MASIFELTEDFLKVKEMMLDDEIDAETLENTLECIECEIEEKAEGYAKVLQYIDGDIAMIEKEVLRLQKKRDVLRNQRKLLRRNLKQAMELTGKRKFQTALFSFSIQKNGGVQPIKIEGEVPERFLIPQKPKPDKAAIREYLKTETVTWAKLLEREESLRIR